MNGFVDYEIQKKNDENNSVSMWTPEGAPIINQLASEFAVFDSWFSSVPTCTDPNRQFSMSGTSNGWVDNFDGTMLTQQTYFDYLMERGITAGGYYMNVDGRCSCKTRFDFFQRFRCIYSWFVFH